MNLLTENELIWSAVVANNRMNRARKASGINSYEKELRLKPEMFLNNGMKTWNPVRWLDLCCGEANALLQYADELAGNNLQHRVLLQGIDLVDQFQPIPPHIRFLQLKVMPLSEWLPTTKHHLITCVHGLHYVGDKLGIIKIALQAIEEGGLFIANLDLASIKVKGDSNSKYVKRFFADNNIDYDARLKITRCVGPRNISIPFKYLGADDNAGPNYTGQEAVDSYYDIG